jgi:hypothetical protein
MFMAGCLSHAHVSCKHCKFLLNSAVGFKTVIVLYSYNANYGLDGRRDPKSPKSQWRELMDMERVKSIPEGSRELQLTDWSTAGLI